MQRINRSELRNLPGDITPNTDIPLTGSGRSAEEMILEILNRGNQSNRPNQGQPSNAWSGNFNDVMAALQPLSLYGPKPSGSNTPWYNPDVPNQPGVPFNRRLTNQQIGNPASSQYEDIVRALQSVGAKPALINNPTAPTGNMIPRAKPNQYGMTRVSPGVYKDEKGATVRSSTGRPKSISMKETAPAKK